MRAFAPLLILIWVAGCRMTDRGAECHTVLDCSDGHYCNQGYCRSDCASDSSCGPGRACSPTGQCLAIGHFLCEEGAAVLPAQVLAALPTESGLLLADFNSLTVQCSKLPGETLAPDPPPPPPPPPPPDDAGTGDDAGQSPSLPNPGAVNYACNLIGQIASDQGDFAALAGAISECRPLSIGSGVASWHVLPHYTEKNPLDTAMVVTWSGDAVNCKVGHQGEGPPGTVDESQTWYSCSGDASGPRVVSVDASKMREIYNQRVALLADGGLDSDLADLAGGLFAFRVERGTDERGDWISNTVTASFDSQRQPATARIRRMGGGFLVRWSAAAPSTDTFLLQLDAHANGRLDMNAGGQSATFCWQAASFAAAAVTPARITFEGSGGQQVGDPSACIFLELEEP